MSDGSKTTIGGYSVTRRLPGAGEAYQARSSEGRRVLVRVFGDSLGVDLETVRREVALSATLDHTAVAKAIDVFDHADELVVVFDYFEGTKLAQIMKRPQSRKRLDGAAIWHLGHRLAGALTQAHTATDPAGDMATLCHGHLGPSQIVIAPKTGELRIDGFGLAALVGCEALPPDGAYQAPEQANNGRVTPRGDLYSVATILWALLAGREPPPPGGEKLSVQECSPPGSIELPAELAEALDRALEPSVGRRKITSMELEQWLGDLADEAAGAAGLAAAARAMVQSGRTLAGTGALAALGMSAPEHPELGAEPAGPGEAAADGAAAKEPAVAVGGADMPFAQAAPPVPGAPTRADRVAKASAVGRVGRKPNVRARQKTLLGAFSVGGSSAKVAEPTAAPVAAPAVAAPPTPTPPVESAGMAAKAARAAAVGRAGAVGKSSVRSRHKTLLGAVAFGGGGAAEASAAGPRQAGARGQASLPKALGGTPIGPPVVAPVAPQGASPDPSGEPAEGLQPAAHGDEDVLEAALAGATVALPAAPEPSAAQHASLIEEDDEPATVVRVLTVSEPGGPAPPSDPSAATDPAAKLSAVAASPSADPTPPPLPVFEPAAALGGGPLAGAPPAPADPVDPLGGPSPQGIGSPGAPPLEPAAATAAEGGSPWSGAAQAPASTPVAAERPLPLWQAVLVALITAVLVAAIGLWWTRRQLTLSETLTDGAPAGSASTASSARPMPSASSTDPLEADPSGAVSATAAASAGASAQASGAATADPAATDADGREGSTLPPEQGLLLVRFDAPPEAQVFRFGKAYGPANQKIAVPCGRTFIRVGTPPGPTWLSSGSSVDVECQALTEVTLEAP